MRLATWNVNSLRVRLPQVLDWLAERQPDILALQETKLAHPAAARDAFEARGYHTAFAGQPTYNGVALLSRAPLEHTYTDFAGLHDPQRRVIGARIEGLEVLNLYVPNGGEVGSAKYRYKLDWLEKVRAAIAPRLAGARGLAVVGDFNIAPADADVHDPELWRDKILCSTRERAALQRLMRLGLSDTFRSFAQDDGTFSWWDYRAAGFRRNRGLRIDLILASQLLSQQCAGCTIDKTPRGWQRPSDHAPVLATFEPVR